MSPSSRSAAREVVLTTWDAREAGRAVGFGVLGFAVACLVTAATDEGGVAWLERVARTLPVAPACAGLGTWLGQARGWARGEGRALAALGRRPSVSSASAVVGGAAVALAAAFALLSARVDASGFFPLARSPDAYVAEDGGAFLDTATGFRVEGDGSLVAPSSSSAASIVATPPVPRHGREAAALSMGVAGLALSMLLARAARGTVGARVALVAATFAGSTVLFHAAAAHRIEPLTAVAPSLALLVVAAAALADRPRSRRARS